MNPTSQKREQVGEAVAKLEALSIDLLSAEPPTVDGYAKIGAAGAALSGAAAAQLAVWELEAPVIDSAASEAFDQAEFHLATRLAGVPSAPNAAVAHWANISAAATSLAAAGDRLLAAAKIEALGGPPPAPWSPPTSEEEPPPASEPSAEGEAPSGATEGESTGEVPAAEEGAAAAPEG